MKQRSFHILSCNATVWLWLAPVRHLKLGSEIKNALKLLMHELYTQSLISAPWLREVLLEEQGKTDRGGTKPHTSFARCWCLSVFFLYYTAFTEVFKSMVKMIFHIFSRGQLMQAATKVEVLLPK